MDDATVIGSFNTAKYLKYEDYNLDNWEKPDGTKRGIADLGAQEGDEPSYKKKKRKILAQNVNEKYSRGDKKCFFCGLWRVRAA